MFALGTLAAACEIVTADFDRIIAIEIPGPDNRQVMVGDTIQLEATPINAAGDPVLDAEIIWAILEVDSGQVGFTLDSATGLVVGVAPGTGRVQAHVETLRSDPITITVTPADSTASVRKPRVARYRLN